MAYLFLALLAYPLAEIFVTAWLAIRIGLIGISIWMITAFFLGFIMLREYKIALFFSFWYDFQKSVLTLSSLLRLAKYYIVAFLFMIPGVLSDLIALILFIWPIPEIPIPHPQQNGEQDLNRNDPIEGKDPLEGECRRVDPSQNDRLIP